jgi:hypothetical protein
MAGQLMNWKGSEVKSIREGIWLGGLMKNIETSE